MTGEPINRAGDRGQDGRQELTRFHNDLESGRRILAMALPENKLSAFKQFAREAVRWHLVGGLPKPDVIDALHLVGVDAGLDDSLIQAALAEAVNFPFLPRPHSHSIPATAADVGRERKDARLVVRRASDIEAQPVQWLWEQRLPMGKVTIIAGEPGLGKSQLTCAIAAAVTTGGPLPLNEGRAPIGSVIILSAEDDASDTIRPRLDAAGADAARVLIVSAVESRNGDGRRAFNLQADLALLEREIKGGGDVILVIIDPVSSYLGKVDSHKNAEMRAVLEPLGELAARLKVAVLAVTHLSKGGNGSANNRFIGSIAFVAAARAAYIIARDPEDTDRRLFIPTKNNVGPEGMGLAFRVQVVETTNGILAPMIIWEGSVSVTAEQVLNAKAEKSDAASRRNDAGEFLRTVLADGALPTRQIQTEAKAAGLSWPTIRRAKEALGILVSKTALDGGWVWSLPHNR